jgi:hypothetical protein
MQLVHTNAFGSRVTIEGVLLEGWIGTVWHDLHDLEVPYRVRCTPLRPHRDVSLWRLLVGHVISSTGRRLRINGNDHRFGNYCRLAGAQPIPWPQGTP